MKKSERAGIKETRDNDNKNGLTISSLKKYCHKQGMQVRDLHQHQPTTNWQQIHMKASMVRSGRRK
eukprot:11732181-Ditylum_brightwellii.AAC.1